MGKAYNLIQQWLDEQAIRDITDAQLARTLGFSQSNLPTWRNPKSMPSPATIAILATTVGVTFEQMRDAFLDDVGYNNPPSDVEIQQAIAKRKEKVRSRGRAARDDDSGEGSQE